MNSTRICSTCRQNSILKNRERFAKESIGLAIEVFVALLQVAKSIHDRKGFG